MCYDHLGNEFKSIQEMCENYNVTRYTYSRRIKAGWSLKDALTIPVKEHTRKCKDHLNNEFSSIAEMCKYYNVEPTTYRFRMNSGWTLEDALTKPNNIKKSCYDHLGNAFTSKKQMCDHYDINYGLFQQRLALGWSLEAALTKNLRDCSVHDHLGNAYVSICDMCAAYNIDDSIYRYRINNGWSLKDALTAPICNGHSCVDHLGNSYPSKTAMAKHYGISQNRLYARLMAGYTLEEALTTPLTSNHGVPCKDHLGISYKSCEEMCKHYNLDAKTYKSRIEKGISIEVALLTPVDITSSLYENTIMRYLEDICITFDSQVVLSGCRSLQNKTMPFDFSIVNVGLIEVDGEGHFKQVSNWDFLRAVENDTLKTTYCETNNIPLLRIRYDQMQDGTYIDLIEDFLANPKDYIKQHNKYLTEAEYYAEREANLVTKSA